MLPNLNFYGAGCQLFLEETGEKYKQHRKRIISNFTIMCKMSPTALHFLCESEHNVSILQNISFPFHLTLPTDKITKGINGIILVSSAFYPLLKGRLPRGW